ncbi:FAD-dependent oxidoreductase [Schlesneria paludicola]|uniref:FAD-dependent oxidoreductase n=1 Tax=Schlesneria paludicola TaxID=360056 RepID=UPI00029B0689|nr:FAD-dependent oxidoreductase [Schlesneria paludicola]
MNYDLLVIGNSRAGAERAAAEALAGRRVALLKSVEKTVRLDVMQTSAEIIVASDNVSMRAWRAEVDRLTRSEMAAEFERLAELGVEQIVGSARFVSPTVVEATFGAERRRVEASDFVLACETRSRRPNFLFANDRCTVVAEDLLKLTDLPRSAVVVGAGATGLSTAVTLATLGVEVVVVDNHATLLELCGLFDSTFDALQTRDVAFRLEDEAIGVTAQPDLQAAVRLASGRQIVADSIVVCVGSEGMVEGLNLEAAGVGVDDRGRVWCDRNGKTWAKQISAVGPIVGAPREFNVPSIDVFSFLSGSGRAASSMTDRLKIARALQS